MTVRTWILFSLYLYSKKGVLHSQLSHILFYILCGHFDEQNRSIPPYPGQRVRRVDASFFQFCDILSCYFEKYLQTMMLKITEHVWIIICFLYKMSKIISEIMIIRTFIAKFWIVAYFESFMKNRNFQVSHVYAIIRNTLADCTHFGMFKFI